MSAVCSPRRFLGRARMMKQPASIASIKEKVDSFCPRMCRKCGSAVNAEVLFKTGLVMLRRMASEASPKRFSKYERTSALLTLPMSESRKALLVRNGASSTRVKELSERTCSEFLSSSSVCGPKFSRCAWFLITLEISAIWMNAERPERISSGFNPRQYCGSEGSMMIVLSLRSRPVRFSCSAMADKMRLWSSWNLMARNPRPALMSCSIRQSIRLDLPVPFRPSISVCRALCFWLR